VVHKWGDPRHGGDSSAIQDQLRLRGVQEVQATESAFAAILDGSVVTWGNPGLGGNRTAQLRNVQQIQATTNAFAAILEDSSVVAWSDPREGGDISEVEGELINVKHIQATGDAFAAILEDGSVDPA
jgi:hypothetical protein